LPGEDRKHRGFHCHIESAIREDDARRFSTEFRSVTFLMFPVAAVMIFRPVAVARR